MSGDPNPPRSRALRRQLAAVAASIAVVVGVFLPPSADATGATATILNHSVKPAVPVDSDRSGVELGLKFVTTRSGTITALQFYRSSAQKESYRGSLWSAAGARLATTRFSASRSVGWQTAKLHKAIRVSRGQTLIASYYAPAGSYATTTSAFTHATMHQGFKIPAGAGVFRYGGVSRFPSSSWHASNYFVDIKFRRLVTPKPVTPSASTVPSGPSGGSGGLAGWQVTQGNVGLAGKGLACRRLPVLDDSKLSKKSGRYVIPAGTTIYRKRLTAQYDLSAGNITIKQSCIQPVAGAVGQGQSVLGTWYSDLGGPVVIEDSECDGSLMARWEQAWVGCFIGVASFYRDYVHNFGSGIVTYATYEATGRNVEIENNLVQHLVSCGNPALGTGDISHDCSDMSHKGNHQSAYTVRDLDMSANPKRQLVIRGNRFNGDGTNMSGTLFLQPNGGTISNVLVEGNLLTGTNPSLYLDYDAGRFPGGAYRGFRKALNNRMTASPYVRPGSGGWIEWKGNYRFDASKPDGRGALITNPS